MATQHGDGGVSLIELLLVIVILGMLATIVMFTVGGMSADARGVGCDADRRAPSSACRASTAAGAEASVAQRGGLDSARECPDNLLAEGFLDADGRLVGATGSPCTI